MAFVETLSFRTKPLCLFLDRPQEMDQTKSVGKPTPDAVPREIRELNDKHDKLTCRR